MNEELNKLYKALSDAAEDYKSAQQALQSAQSIETAALNELNKAQAAFDTFLAKMKREAPHKSDWKRSERVGIAVKE